MSKLSLKPDSKFCNEEPIVFFNDPIITEKMQQEIPMNYTYNNCDKLAS